MVSLELSWDRETELWDVHHWRINVRTGPVILLYNFEASASPNGNRRTVGQ